MRYRINFDLVIGLVDLLHLALCKKPDALHALFILLVYSFSLLLERVYEVSVILIIVSLRNDQC